MASIADPRVHCFTVSLAYTPFKSLHGHTFHEFCLCLEGPGVQWTDAGALATGESHYYVYVSANRCGEESP